VTLSLTGSSITLQIIGALWLIWAAYWLVSALGQKPVRRHESPLARLSQIAFIGAAFYLLVSLGHRSSSLWRARFVPATAVVSIAAIALTFAGVAFSIWARYCLGRNWSAAVTIREGHELIRRGPYARIRHPIYTGMLIALIGTALGIGELRALVAFALVLFGFVLKARREERLLASEFGAAFEEHRRHTGFFLPRLGA